MTATPPPRTETSPSLHHFDGSGEAYDASQTDPSIKDGDVLIIRSEGVVGFLFEAWPIATTASHGEFHGPAVDRIACTREAWLAAHPSYTESWTLADSWACGYGIPLLADAPTTEGGKA